MQKIVCWVLLIIVFNFNVFGMNRLDIIKNQIANNPRLKHMFIYIMIKDNKKMKKKKIII